MAFTPHRNRMEQLRRQRQRSLALVYTGVALFFAFALFMGHRKWAAQEQQRIACEAKGWLWVQFDDDVDPLCWPPTAAPPGWSGR